MASKHKQRGWVSALIGAAAGMIGANKANKDAEENSATSVAQTRYLRQSQASDTVAGLKGAGLNPMLGYQNMATASQVPAAPVQNVGEKMATSAASMAALENVNAQNKLLEAQAQKATAEAQAIPTSTANVAQQTQNLKATMPKIEQEVKNLKLQARTEEERVVLTRAQKFLAETQEKLAKGQIDNVEAQTRTQDVMTKLRKLEIPGAKNLAQWEETLGQYAKEAGAAGTAAKVLGGLKNSAGSIIKKLGPARKY